jgi:GNAT superfamily N-acetyltransferase
VSLPIQIIPQNWGFSYCGRKRRIGPLQKHPGNFDIRIFAAKQGERVLGTIILDVYEDHKTVWIMDVFVRKSVRRQGIAKALIHFAADKFPARKLEGTFVHETLKKYVAKINAARKLR